MIRWIDWIEARIDGFFKLNGFLWLISIVITVTGFYFITSGWMMNSTGTWTNAQQWAMWWPAIHASFIALLFSILFFIRIYLVFPVIVLYMTPSFSFTLYNIKQILENGFIHPIPNLSSLFDFLVFTLAVIGTIVWGRKMYYRFYKK